MIQVNNPRNILETEAIATVDLLNAIKRLAKEWEEVADFDPRIGNTVLHALGDLMVYLLFTPEEIEITLGTKVYKMLVKRGLLEMYNHEPKSS